MNLRRKFHLQLDGGNADDPNFQTRCAAKFKGYMASLGDLERMQYRGRVTLLRELELQEELEEKLKAISLHDNEGGSEEEKKKLIRESEVSYIGTFLLGLYFSFY